MGSFWGDEFGPSANIANIKQFFGPEKLRGLSRKGPLKIYYRDFGEADPCLTRHLKMANDFLTLSLFLFIQLVVGPNLPIGF